jgi:uncharacterized YccA/Bax inhibitor family protein
MMRTANPALNAGTFTDFGTVTRGTTMTLQGTVQKTGALLILVMVSGAYTWSIQRAGGNAAPWILGGALGGLIVGFVTAFKKTWSPVTAPIYAILEGLFLGGISAALEAKFKGIVFSAIALTAGTLLALLMAYQSRLIKATENFKLGIFAATGGIMFIYVIGMIMGLFGVRMPYIHESGMIGIGFSVFVVIIAALNLVLDFDFIEQGAQQGAPKYMEWYGAFGLLVTLVWLYVEILRLLAKLNSRR